MAGRKSKLTKEVRGSLIESTTLGLKIEDACALAGISQTSYFNWLQQGALGKSALYVEFLEAIKAAEPKGKQASLARIDQAGRGGGKYTETRTTHFKNGEIETVITEKEMLPDWKADAWRLERKYPEEFGQRYRLDVTDWRKQAERAGAKPEEIDGVFQKLVEGYAGASARGDEAGSVAGGTK